MAAISKESVLKLFRNESCLDLRKLAARHSVDTGDAVLTMVVGDLERNGKICRIGGTGRRVVFVLATFEG